jgi:hypothetical protein
MTSRPGATAFDPEIEAAIADIKRMREQMKREREQHRIKEESAA